MAAPAEVKVNLVDFDLVQNLIKYSSSLLFTARAVVNEQRNTIDRKNFFIRDGLSPAIYEMNKAIEDLETWMEGYRESHP